MHIFQHWTNLETQIQATHEKAKMVLEEIGEREKAILLSIMVENW